MKKDIVSQLKLLTPHVKLNEPLSNHTTFRIGGPAKYFVNVESLSELKKIRDFCRQNGLPFLVLGGGSNILVGDSGYKGVVVRLAGEFCLYTFGRNIVKCGAGLRLPVLVRKCAEKGLLGVEYLAGIPGCVGGAIIGNAGTAEGSIGDNIIEVEVLDESGHIINIKQDSLKFNYRDSNLHKYIIISATLHLIKGKKNDILKNIDEFLARRWDKQPLDKYNAGSVFKNPEGTSAGKLIDEAGLKGLSFGGARVSEKHANFIVNTGEAKASDVKALIKIVHQKISEKYGIDLGLEIKILGE